MTLDNNMKFKEDKEMELCKLNPGRVGTGRSLLSEKYVAPATDMDRLTGLGRNTTSFFLHLLDPTSDPTHQVPLGANCPRGPQCWSPGTIARLQIGQ